MELRSRRFISDITIELHITKLRPMSQSKNDLEEIKVNQVNRLPTQSAEPQYIQKESPKKIDRNGFSEKFNKLCPDYAKKKLTGPNSKRTFNELINFRRSLNQENLKKQTVKQKSQKSNKCKPRLLEISKCKDTSMPDEIQKEPDEPQLIDDISVIDIPKDSLPNSKQNEETSAQQVCKNQQEVQEKSLKPNLQEPVDKIQQENLQSKDIREQTSETSSTSCIQNYIDKKVCAVCTKVEDPKVMIKLSPCGHYIHNQCLKDKTIKHRYKDQFILFCPCDLCNVKIVSTDEIKEILGISEIKKTSNCSKYQRRRNESSEYRLRSRERRRHLYNESLESNRRGFRKYRRYLQDYHDSEKSTSRSR
ncbi:unnamed protein product [Moneuplotes crassus]|uniref:RING-type domain-containing protein n=1 Tax=Euplotes crassus TaxID=5936 RepID=A0AAD1UFB1_EUPCR|nr:unnamed protein product [Moneuplotes crassus]